VCGRLDEQTRERARIGLDLPWLTRPGKIAIADLERRKLGSCDVARSLRWWTYFIKNPYHRLYDLRYEGCGIFECCPDPVEVRYILDVACHVLPITDAKEFRRRLVAIDEHW